MAAYLGSDRYERSAGRRGMRQSVFVSASLWLAAPQGLQIASLRRQKNLRALGASLDSAQ